MTATKSDSKQEDGLSEELTRLFAGGDDADDDYVPGEADSRPPPARLEMLDGIDLARLVRDAAHSTDSAASKTRGLAIAGQLFAGCGKTAEAEAAIREAAETSPKLGFVSLLLRKFATSSSDGAIERSLESVSRLASRPQSRRHAALALLRRYSASEETEQAGNFLDQTARSDDAGLPILLERVIHRVVRNASLAGVVLPEALENDLASAFEVITGHALKSDRDDTVAKTVPNSSLVLLRAARHLHQGASGAALHPLSALLGTENSPFGAAAPSNADFLELTSSLRASEDGGLREAAMLLRDAYASSPSRRLLRTLAARIVELNDKEWLTSLLEQADPGSGTFAIEERVLLATLCGKPLTLGEAELAELSKDQRTLAHALAPLNAPALNVTSADLETLLIQLGAGLPELQPHPERASDAYAALEELERRDEASELTRALRTGISLFSESSLDLTRTVRDLAIDSDDARCQLIIGALFERLGASEEATDAYQSASVLSPHYASAATRGLRALFVQNTGPNQNQNQNETAGLHDIVRVVQGLASGTEDEGLRFSRHVSLALTKHSVERATETAEAAKQLLDGSDSSLREPAGFLALVAALHAKIEDKDFLIQPLYEQLNDQDTFLGRMCLIRQLFETGSSTRALSYSMRRSLLGGDPSERALATWLDLEAEPDGTPANQKAESPPSYQGDSVDLVDTTTQVERLITSMTQLATGDFSRAAESLRAHAKSFAGLMEIGQDLSEIEGDASRLSPVWLDRAQSTDDDDAKRYAYERLASLDERRGDLSSATLWRKTLAEEFPSHVPSLLGLEEQNLKNGNISESTQEKLAEILPPGDRDSYQMLAAARALANSDLRAARRHLDPLLALERPPAIALRGLATVARERRDDELLIRCLEHLAEGRATDLDKAAVAIELGHLLARVGRLSEAQSWAKKSLLQKPNNFPAAWLLYHLANTEDALERAEGIEAFAQAVLHQSHRAELWSAAADAWLKAGDISRAAPCYEKTLEAAPSSLEAFNRLFQIRSDEKRYDAVQQLVETRLGLISEKSPEALELELKLADLLAAQGRAEEAKQHLERALVLQPENSNALRSHAEVSALLGAHESAERSLVALRDRLPPSAERTSVQRSLARLYDTHLGQLERAMDAYQAVLVDAPDDEESTHCLIDVFCRLGFAERATALQTQLIQSSDVPEKKRAGALKLAAIYENVAHDVKRAGATLERTRKAWPLDADALEATVRFMDRHGSDGSRGFLLDRVGKDARRRLEAGHLDGALLDTLARVALLSGRVSEAEGCSAARAALLSLAQSALNGAGVHALNSRVDEVIAPRGLAAPLRNLLRKTGQAMDAAFSVDLAQLGAAPVRSGVVFDRVAQVSEALRIAPPQLFVSPSLGARCLPVTTNPARLVIGSKLETLPGRERDYLLLRGFKLLELGVGALARSRDEDRWPMLAALLQLFAPSWQPPSVDTRKTAQAKAAIEQGLARVGYDDDVPMLALEAIGSIGGQEGSLGEATRVLANRAALIAVGDLSSVLSAIAAGEGVTLSDGGPSRFRWIETHQEARDLVLFSSGPKHARAREGLGLVEKDGTSGGTAPTSASRVPSSPNAQSPMHSRAPAIPSRGPPAPPKRKPKADD